MTSQDNAALERLLEYLKETRGFDFTGYKRTTLGRRFGKRMSEVKVDRYEGYTDYLEVHPEEFSQLFDTILINVTSFFRDPEAWTSLAETAIPRIDQLRGNGQIRVWCAGCATGQEAYTAAIVFAETLGFEAFEQRVKVYATDADEDALATARHGIYTTKELEAVPEELVPKYFDEHGSGFTVKKRMRRSVIFGRHDLVQDAPISRLDLLICRNTLMYFNADLQNRILKNFHFALVDKGMMFLGKAETMLTHGELFVPVELKHRLFQKAPSESVDHRVGDLHDADGLPLARHLKLREAAIEAAPVAQILLDNAGMLLLANRQARQLFNIVIGDIGRPVQDLEISYRPLELRSRIDAAYAERSAISVSNVERVLANGDVQSFEVSINPVYDPEGDPLGASVSFTDVTHYRRLRQELERSNQELETAYEVLQSTNEELETTNEELQSTVEELETTNEELQSSNEELETTNEELQSTNAEVQAMNEDVRRRSDDQGRAMAMTDGILSSLNLAVIVVDLDMQVVSWSEQATEMWGFRAAEAEGHLLASLEFGLAISELEPVIAKAFGGESGYLDVKATNRRGRGFTCRITCQPFVDGDGATRGAVLLLER